MSLNGEHFTARPNPDLARRMEVDGLLMVLANRSLPLYKNTTEKDRLKTARNVSAIGNIASNLSVARTRTGFGRGELIINDGTLTFRAQNLLNSLDTAYVLEPNGTDFAANRFDIPKNLADTLLVDGVLNDMEIAKPKDFNRNPELADSVMRAANLFYKLAVNNCSR